MSPRKAPLKANDQLRRSVLEHFARLHVPITAEELDSALRMAQQQHLGQLAFLEQLIGAAARQRRERAMERRIRQANFPELKTLEEFDWDFNRKAIDRAQFEELGSADFITRHDNVIFVGQSGVGKSHLLIALGIRACAAELSVRYETSASLITRLTAALADGSYPKVLRRYALPDFLVVDEFGLDKVERSESPHAASLLYKVIESRYTKRSTAISTNIDFEHWGSYLDDGPLAMAFLDRLVDHAILLKINGKSYRASRAQQHKPSSKSSSPA